MTIKISMAPDCFSDNDVFQLPGFRSDHNVDIAAMSWIASNVGGLITAHQECLLCAVSQIAVALPGYRTWLLGSHTAFQPNNRIIRHRKFWSSLKARGITIPTGSQLAERDHVCPLGVRWCGAIEFPPNESSFVAKIVEEEPASHLVAVTRSKEDIVSKLVATGWDRSEFGPSTNVLREIVGAQGVVLHLVGWFDDAEAGVIAFAQPDIVRCIEAK